MKYEGKSRKMVRRSGFILLTSLAISFMGVNSAEAAEVAPVEEGGSEIESDLSGFRWVNRDEKWVYSDPATGRVKFGWLQLGDLSLETGEMQKGWQEIEGKWYYFNPVHGHMRTGWLQSGDKWFYLSPETGEMQKGWQEINGKWYYFNPVHGHMQTGWIQVNGKWYYLNMETGVMKTGWMETAKGWYFFSKIGVMQTSWVEFNGKWYYMDPDSGLMQTGWVSAGEKDYYLNSRGAMRTGWFKDEGKWYYLESNGASKTGWLEEDGKYYYFKENREGMAAAEVIEVDGKRQGFSGTGEWMGRRGDAFWDAYEKAIVIVQEVTDDSMTTDQKLRACLAYMQNNKHLGQPWIPHYKEKDWVEKYANHMFDNTYGNCFCFAACFGLMARVIGCEDVYCCNNGIHGWCEIGGNVYDPQWTIYHVEKWNRPLMKGDSPNYLGSITRTDGNWQYIPL